MIKRNTLLLVSCFCLLFAACTPQQPPPGNSDHASGPTPDTTTEAGQIITALDEADPTIQAQDYHLQVLQSTGRYATGNLTETGNNDNQIFFAINEGDGWQVVWHGKGVPPCSAINPLGFPKSLSTECADSNGNSVPRR